MLVFAWSPRMTECHKIQVSICIHLFLRSFDIILCGLLGWKHQLTDCSYTSWSKANGFEVKKENGRCTLQPSVRYVGCRSLLFCSVLVLLHHSPQPPGETTDAEIKAPLSLRTRSYPSLGPGVSQNIALHALSAAGNSVSLISAFPIHSV